MFKKLIRFFGKHFENAEKAIQNFFDKKISKKGTGKITSPEKSKTIVIYGLICFTVAYFAILITESNQYVGDGLTYLEKEKRVKFGETEVQNINKIEVGDPLEEIENEEISEEEKCTNLSDKVKKGITLDEFEKELFRNCLKSGILGLSDEEQKAMNMLTQDDLTDAEKKALIGLLEGDEDSKALARALMSNDENVREAAKTILNNPNLSEDEKNALLGVIDGSVTDPSVIDALLSGDPELRKMASQYVKTGDPSILDSIKEKLEKKNQIKGEDGDTSGMSVPNKIKLANDIKERIKERAKQLGFEEEILEDLRDQVSQRGIFPKLENGEKLTPEEEKLYSEYLKQRNKVNALRRDQEKDIALYKQITSELEISLGSLGFTGIKEDGFIKEMVEKASSNPYQDQKIVDLDGNVVPLSIYKIIKKKIQLARNSSDFEGSLVNNLSPLDIKNSKVAVAGLTVWSRNPLDGVVLPSDLRIPIVSESAIFVSSNAPSGKRVVFRFQDNVLNPETDEILIPLGSKIIGQTGSFDELTKLITIEKLDTIIVNGEKLDISFDVMTANGYSGIPGGVKSTRKEKITAAMLSQFMSSMSEYFSLVVQDQTGSNENLDPVTALTAGGLDAAAKGGDKLTEMLVQDFQNAKSVFYAPKGMKLILTPK